MGRRITRKQLKQDDEFVSAAEIVFRWISDNRRPLVAGLAGLAVAALAWWGAMRANAHRKLLVAA